MTIGQIEKTNKHEYSPRKIYRALPPKTKRGRPAKVKVYDVSQNESQVPPGGRGSHKHSHRGNQAARQCLLMEGVVRKG